MFWSAVYGVSLFDQLEDELQTYYQQIRDITNTLQKELQTKEELASELRDAYEKLRSNAKARCGFRTHSLRD